MNNYEETHEAQVNSQALALSMIEQHKEDAKFRSKVREILQSHEKSLQAPIPVKEWQAVQDETLKVDRTVPEWKGIVYGTAKQFLLQEGMTGTIYADDVAIQTFVTKKDWTIKLTNTPEVGDSYVENGFLVADKGELKLLWSNLPTTQKVVASYEYNIAKNKPA